MILVTLAMSTRRRYPPRDEFAASYRRSGRRSCK
jgi:hypothetical protein